MATGRKPFRCAFVSAAADLALPGWHAPECGRRWTNGAAMLDLPAAETADLFVDVHVVGTLRYAAADDHTHAV